MVLRSVPDFYPEGTPVIVTTSNLVTLWLSQNMSNSYSYYRKFGNAYSFQGCRGVNTDLVELNGWLTAGVKKGTWLPHDTGWNAFLAWAAGKYNPLKTQSKTYGRGLTQHCLGCVNLCIQGWLLKVKRMFQHWRLVRQWCLGNNWSRWINKVNWRRLCRHAV